MDQHQSLRDALNGTPEDQAKSEAISAGTAPASTANTVRAGQPPSHADIAPPSGNGAKLSESHPDIVPPNNEEAPAPSWLAQNAPALIICAVVLGYLVWRFNLDDLWSIAKAAIGLSLVVFIHELGHFLVAKWCDVNVTTFSIGFGPPIPGCSFQWGETTYKLALFPLGGYVQMVGQIDGDESSDGSEDDPRSYRNKSVWQRMAIISAGVTMNVILAVVCFVAVFLIPGKDRQEPTIDLVDTGSPAYAYGIRTGTLITSIGSHKDPYFENVKFGVMATGENDKIELGLRYKDESRTIDIAPRKDKKDLAPMIGFAPGRRLQLSTRRYLDASFTSPAWPFSPAADAGFKFGDMIVGCSYDPEHPEKVDDLPRDPRLPAKGESNYPGYEQCDYFAFARRMQDMAGKPVRIVVERRTDETAVERVPLVVQPAFNLSLGTVMDMGQITAIRMGSPAADARIQPFDKEKNSAGDKIVGVACKVGDKTVVWGGAFSKPIAGAKEEKVLDPMRLPFELRREMAKVPTDQKKVTLYLYRENADRGAQNIEVTVELAWQDSWKYDRAEPSTEASPWSINELGLAYLVTASVARDSAPLKKGDEIKEFQITYRTNDGEDKVEKWTKMGPNEWAWFYANVFLSGAPVKSVAFKVNRAGETVDVDMVPTVDTSWPMNNRGWLFMPDLRRQRADNVFDAVALGFQDTHNSIIHVFQTLHGMFRGRLSVKNLGGPLTIANTAFHIAGVNFWEFVFFLGLISVNLAVINFLPIPVLDGGHMVFLIYEKIRGQPASEAVRAGATYVGLLMILCLMFFVLYLDVTRLFW